jgi:DNA repair exonuclease SbcCD ATPase subunit
LLPQNQLINHKNIEIEKSNININNYNDVNNTENITKELKDEIDNLQNNYKEYEKKEKELKNKTEKLKQDENEFKKKEKALKNKIIELNNINQNLKNFSFYQDLNIEFPIYSFDYNILMLSLFNLNNNNKKISFIIKNNGINQWIMDKTFLKMRKNEYFSSEIIKLDELKPNEFQEINLILKEEKSVDIGIIHIIFDFIVEDKIFDESLYIDIENCIL